MGGRGLAAATPMPATIGDRVADPTGPVMDWRLDELTERKVTALYERATTEPSLRPTALSGRRRTALPVHRAVHVEAGVKQGYQGQQPVERSRADRPGLWQAYAAVDPPRRGGPACRARGDGRLVRHWRRCAVA